ncbi:hypothetical protein ASD8599_00659 [Ascidiaceihabitans donghaensis]|uniref:UspA domain-containing protein n=1 Tax=Ascidiaceihabitans donghaensis TaxID=1510460 RepID=A0A2R8BA41_9RHOB|nr:universal stress protein [Ascidiaceihabitans donghaensis]SPH19919.1 hypothetical protein ASD8599_00659 [Ascidiaceihabitans donghaensis]
MTFKSIMTVLTEGTDGMTALPPAMALAQQYDAHLDALALGLDRTQTGYTYGDISALVLETARAAAIQEAEALESQATQVLRGASVRAAIMKAIATTSDITRVVASHARFNDLVVLNQPYGPDAGPDAAAVVEACLFDAGVPTLICPKHITQATAPRRVVLAWNESAEALAATRAALPILKAAETVFITVIDPPTHGPTRSDPGGPLSQMLARHGVRCEVDVLGKTLPRISDVLNRHVQDKDVDMLIMGAYGHSRFREAIFGGATRNMLEGATVPVFMAR